MRYLRATLAMAGLALALIFPGSAAAIVLDIEVESPAQLVAKGAAVDVSVTVTCDASVGDLFVDAIVTQRRGNDVAQGFGSRNVACTGSAQTLTVRVPAQSDITFKQNKSAVASAELFGCDATGCGSDTDSEVIEIVK